MTDFPTVELSELTPAKPIELAGRGTLPVRDLGDRDAPAVLMLHGWTVTSDLNWAGQYGRLSDKYRVIAFDHAGHGSGLRPRKTVTIKSLADDAVAVMDALDIDRFVVFGYSLGGAVAQQIAKDYPNRLNGLVLSATLPSFVGGKIWPAILDISGKLSRISPKFIVDKIFAARLEKRTQDLHDWGKQQVMDHYPRILLEVGASMFRFDARAWLPSISVPTAVVVTSNDPKTRPEHQEAFAKFIEGTTLHHVPGEHDAPVRRPDDYNVGLIEAIDSVLARTS